MFGTLPSVGAARPYPTTRFLQGRFGPRDGHLRRRFMPRLLDHSLAPPEPPAPPPPAAPAAPAVLRAVVPPHAPWKAVPSPRHVVARGNGGGGGGGGAAGRGRLSPLAAVAALRLGNGVAVCVDEAGVIDVLHWEVRVFLLHLGCSV